jgi:UDP-galactopyranose mutase
MDFDCIVAGSHLRFDGPRRRPRHVLTRLAKRVPVLYVEEPFFGAEEHDRLIEEEGLTVLRPVRRSLEATRLDGRTLAVVRDWVGERRPLVWLYAPMMFALADTFPEAPLAYDCMEELSALAYVPLELKSREKNLLERADPVFAGGRSLYDSRRELGSKVKLYPSGVEFEHFAPAATMPPHPLVVHLARPVYGCFGMIDDRVDFDLIRSLAERAASVVLAGPVMKIDPAMLPRRANVHFTGQVAYADLPSYLAGFDVALLPYALNPSTASLSPAKTPEYLAGGKPVVATPIPDVVADWGDLVTIAETPEAFADACTAAARHPDSARGATGVERARAAGWDAIVASMWADLTGSG